MIGLTARPNEEIEMIGRFVAVLVTGATIWPTAVTSTMAKNVVNIYTTPKAYKEATGK